MIYITFISSKPIALYVYTVSYTNLDVYKRQHFNYRTLKTIKILIYEWLDRVICAGLAPIALKIPPFNYITHSFWIIYMIFTQQVKMCIRDSLRKLSYLLNHLVNDRTQTAALFKINLRILYCVCLLYTSRCV